MANLTAAAPIKVYGDPLKIDIPCNAAATYFQGQLIFCDATSGLTVQQPASGDTFLGVCAEGITTTAASQMIPVYIAGAFGFKIASSTAADIGEYCYSDASGITNNPGDLVASTDITEAANDCLIGQIYGFESPYAIVLLSTTHPVYVGTSTDNIPGFYPVAL